MTVSETLEDNTCLNVIVAWEKQKRTLIYDFTFLQAYSTCAHNPKWFSGSFSTNDFFAVFSHRAQFVLHFLFIVLLSCMSIKITKAFMSRPFIHLQFPKSHHLLTCCYSLSRWFCFHGTCVGGLVTCIISRVSSMRECKWERERKRV